MGGGVSSKHAEAIAEFVTQKGKPGDASDVSTLEAAHTEIQKLRALTQLLDIHDFDAYVRSKQQRQQELSDPGGQPAAQSPSGPHVITHIEETTPAAASNTRSIPATDALEKVKDVSQIAHAVRVKLDNRMVSLHEAFQKLDLKHCGYITKQEFLDACWYWGVQLQESDFSVITAKAGDGGTGRMDGTIDYPSFVELMSQVTHAEYPLENASQSPHPGRRDQSIDDVLRSRIIDSGLTMKQCFKEYDKDNSGCIEREEMQQVLNGLNVRYTEDHLNELFYSFDINGDGKFQYSEFVRLVQNSM